MRRDADDPERQQVEWVFMLTGGELDDEPWNGFAYNYDGVPEYAASDFEDTFEYEYRTVIGSFLYGGPPERIVAAEGAWELRATFVSSGEAECPLRREVVDEERCRLCDETRGEPHGYIYLGDGW